MLLSVASQTVPLMTLRQNLSNSASEGSAVLRFNFAAQTRLLYTALKELDNV